MGRMWLTVKRSLSRTLAVALAGGAMLFVTGCAPAAELINGETFHVTESGVVGDATRARVETGERIVAALVPRIVQVCKEMAGKES